MRTACIWFAIAAASAPAALAQQPPIRAWGEFSVHALLERTSTRVEIGLSRGGADNPEYRFRGEIVDRRGAPARIVWADTGSCPSSLDQLRALQRLSMPQPDVPWIDEGVAANEIILDGASYTLKMDGAWPDQNNINGTTIAIGSNVGTPLAKWVHSMLAALKPCWKPAA